MAKEIIRGELREINLMPGLGVNGDDKEIKISLEEAKKRNLAFFEKAGVKAFDDRILYNKSFLLEVSMAGYNPLDSEDVENYINNLPAKNLERNLKIAGVDVYNELGQSDYEEDELGKFLKANKEVNVSVKQPGEKYLTDFTNNTAKRLLQEEKEVNFNFHDEFVEKDKRSVQEILESHLKTTAMNFQSENIEIEKPILNTNTEIVRSSKDAEKILNLIKELKNLGFTPEEIKFEIKNLR